MHIYLGSDHNGIEIKRNLKDFLEKKYSNDEDSLVLDLGVFTNDATEYLDIEREVCEKVLENPDGLGIVFSSNGSETCTLANKTNGITAVLLDNGLIKETSKRPNVLCFPANLTDLDLIKKTVAEFTDNLTK